MKHQLKIIYHTITSLGIDPLKAIHTIRGYPTYFYNLLKLKSTIRHKNSKTTPNSVKKFGNIYPITDEFSTTAGTASGQYFHQDLLVANYIYRCKPRVHLDIGSRIDGFIAHLLSFEQETILGDVRPIEIQNPNISFIRLDMTEKLDKSFIGKYESVSCLHAIEHMGLGRYGDPVNAWGHYLALHNLTQLLKVKGKLYLSHPTGKKSRIEYNAHRVISLGECREMFAKNGLKVTKFAYVDDSKNLIKIKNNDYIDYQSSYGLEYGCAIWTLEKY